MTIIMVLGMSITALANNDAAVIKSVTAKNATVYTNGTDAEKQVAVTVNWDKNKAEPVKEMITATSADRGIVNVVGCVSIEKTANGKSKAILQLDPVSNGKTKVTIKASNGKKKVITVTVKTYADGIAFSDQVEDGTIVIANAKGTKVNLGAKITNNATDKKIKYSVVADEDNNNMTASKLGIKVDSKGNVIVTKDNPADTVVTVKSNDGKVVKKVTVKTTAPVVTAFDIAKDSTSTKEAFDSLNKKYVVKMKGNKNDVANTYQLMVTGGAKASDLTFASNKESIAKVDANGKITAVGNGTAKITVTPKLGNKVSKTVTVKVSTDVEYVKVDAAKYKVIANNKATAKITATTNANASNKAVKYEISGVKDASGKTVATKDVKNFVSVSSKGIVKAKAACTAYVRAYAKADGAIGRTVEVTAVVPVKEIAIKVTENTEKYLSANKKSATVYRVNYDGSTPLSLYAKVNDDASDKNVTWTSSKSSIASFMVDDNGNVRVNEDGSVNVVGNSNGTATITAKANDGSGKKATFKVTVKTDAHDIIVDKAVEDVSGNVIYVKGTEAAKTYDVAKTVAAKTNKDASNKKLSYSDKKVTLAAGQSKMITVTANDKRTHNDEGAVSVDVWVAVIDENLVATEYEVAGLEYLEDMEYAFVGETFAVSPKLVAKDSAMKVVNPTDVKLKSSNTKVLALKNNVFTAKKEGIATVTATANGKVVGTYPVKVTRSSLAVAQQFDKVIAASVKAENREYTGFKTTYTPAKLIGDIPMGSFRMDIIDDVQLDNLENTGIFRAIRDIMKHDANVRVEGMLVMAGYDHNNSVPITFDFNEMDESDAFELVDYIKEVYLDGGRSVLLHGTKFYVVLGVEDKRSTGTYEHSIAYELKFEMSPEVFDKALDDNISRETDSMNLDGVTLSYDATNNYMEATVNETDISIEAFVEEEREEIISSLRSMFSFAEEITLNATVGDYIETVTKSRENDGDDYINDLVDEYVDRLIAHGFVTLEDLESTIMTADVTYKVGFLYAPDVVVNPSTFKYSYEFKVLVDDSCRDAQKDAYIQSVVDDYGVFEYGNISYVADANAVNVVFNEGTDEVEIANLEGAGFKSIIDALFNGSASKVTVINGSKVTAVTIDAEKEDDTMAILKALMGEATTFGDLDDSTSVVKVLYASTDGKAVELIYTINYDVKEVVVEGLVEDGGTVSGNEPGEGTVSGNEPGDETVSGNEAE